MEDKTEKIGEILQIEDETDDELVINAAVLTAVFQNRLKPQPMPDIERDLQKNHKIELEKLDLPKLTKGITRASRNDEGDSVTPKDPFSDQQLSTATLIPVQKPVSGRFSFTQISANNLRVSGMLTGLPRGEHAVLIHQFGDLSDGCSRLGPPFLFKGVLCIASLDAVVGSQEWLLTLSYDYKKIMYIVLM
ncbi:hypothetical protein Q1695_002844 [Nippostrongylus brasiliensis]|nr:hypothetical protein Q1695_002844 [Nippostrongylus brasiliensis]